MERVEKASSRLPSLVAQALADAALILTPNHRIAHALRRAYDGDMQRVGHSSWVPPEIFAVESWMAQAWQRLALAGSVKKVLLNSTQELSLWRSIIAADAEASALRSFDALAGMAASSWRLLCAYNGRSRGYEFAAGTDARAFQRWSQSLQTRLRQDGYLTLAELPLELRLAGSAADLLAAKTHIVLVDFEVISPALRVLLTVLERSGCRVTEHKTSSGVTRTTSVVEAQDGRAELQRAALWIKERLNAHPAAKIAVVVPDLAGRRAEITRIFGQTLAPQLERFSGLSHPARSSGLMEFSLGVPLYELPVIAAAFDLLRWCMEPLPIASVSDLLLSPFFGSASFATDPLVLAEFDALELRRHAVLRPLLSLPGMIRLLEGSPRKLQLASLLAQCKSLYRASQSELPDAGRQQSYADSSATFTRLLGAAGWSRVAQSDSLLFQTHRRFEAALDELASLDFDGSRVTSAEAFEALQRIARHFVFAPESQDAPVQVMGPLEVGGVPFDGLWFLGAGDLAWPSSPPSSHLLPRELKRALALPGSDLVQDQAVALELTRRIAASAAEVVFSFAVETGDGVQHLSPILSQLPLIPLTASSDIPEPVPIAVETFFDSTSLPSLPDRVTRGGAQVLEAQAACAFRAFAEHRLWSSELSQRSLGFDDMERGSLVHRVMEHFWNHIKDGDELRALRPIERDLLLDECVDLALKHTRVTPESPWDEAYLVAQRKRLAHLLRRWLQAESDRPAFTVRIQEKRLEDVPLGPLRLALRVDRMDDTEAGTLILDYKTGKAHPSEWQSERPDAPQLPLYAVLSGEPISGIAFALLRAGDDLGFKGVADSTDLFGPTSRLALPMRDQIELWRRDLTALAVAFDHGDPRPDPKTYPKTCSRCAQRIVCRLDPSKLNPFDEDEDLLAEEFSFG